MNTVFKWLLRTSYVQSAIIKAVRNLIVTGGAALMAYMQAKGFPQDASSQFIGDLVSAAMLAAGYGLSWLDFRVVGKKIDVALNAPSPQQIQDMLDDKLHPMNDVAPAIHVEVNPLSPVT